LIVVKVVFDGFDFSILIEKGIFGILTYSGSNLPLILV